MTLKENFRGIRKLGRILAVLFVLALSWLFSPGQASAHPALGSLSPFQGTQHNHFLCKLKYHQRGLPCPHSHETSWAHSGSLQIAPECGGLPQGHLPPHFSVDKNPSMTRALLGPADLGIQTFLQSTQTFHQFLDLDPPQHPPKTF